MKVEINPDSAYVECIQNALKQNDGYCPCALEKNADTLCMCKDFKENVLIGDFCHCGLYKKIS